MSSVRRPELRSSGSVRPRIASSRRIGAAVARLGTALALVTVTTVGLGLAPGSAATAATTTPSPAPTASSDAAAGADAGSDATTEQSAVVVSAGAVGTGILAPAQDLTIDVTVQNATTSALVLDTVRVNVADNRIQSNAELDAWLDPSESDAVSTVLDDVELRVEPESSAQLTVTVPAASLAFPTSVAGTGTRGIEVAVVDSDDEVVARSRSTIEWMTGNTERTTAVSAAVPLVAPRSGSGLLTADELATYTGPGGTLTRQLENLAGRQVAIGIDPRILASIRILGSTAPPSALGWLTRLAEVPNDTFALQYADADVSAQAQAGVATLLAPSSFEYAVDDTIFAPEETDTPAPTSTPAAYGAASLSALQLPTPAPTEPGQGTTEDRPTLEELLAWNYTVEGVAWPIDATVVSTDLPVYAASGISTTIVSSDNLSVPALTALGTTIAPDSTGLLVADADAGSAFDAAIAAQTDGEWNEAMTVLSSEIALLERTNDEGAAQVFLAAGRSEAASGPRVTQTLDALAERAWVQPQSLGSAIAAAPLPAATATINDSPVSESRLGTVRAVLDRATEIDAFSSILDTPEELTGRHRADLLALLGTAWVPETSDWATAVAESLAASSKILSSVAIEQSSTILLVSRNTSIPVAIRNDLPWPVTITIDTATSNGVLDIDEENIEPTTVDASSQGRAVIPVKARIGNGETSLSLQLRSETGVAIDSSASVQLNVRADWETVGTLVVAVIVVAVFGIGLVRNIARRRRGGGTDDDPDDVDPNSVLETQPDDSAGGTAPPRG